MNGELVSQNMVVYRAENISQEKQTLYMNHLAALKEKCRKAENRFKQKERELVKG